MDGFLRLFFTSERGHSAPAWPVGERSEWRGGRKSSEKSVTFFLKQHVFYMFFTCQHTCF